MHFLFGYCSFGIYIEDKLKIHSYQKLISWCLITINSLRSSNWFNLIDLKIHLIKIYYHKLNTHINSNANPTLEDLTDSFYRILIKTSKIVKLLKGRKKLIWSEWIQLQWELWKKNSNKIRSNLLENLTQLRLSLKQTSIMLLGRQKK